MGIVIVTMAFFINIKYKKAQTFFVVLPHFAIQQNKIDWWRKQLKTASGLPEDPTIVIISPDHFLDKTTNNQEYNTATGMSCFHWDCVNLAGIFSDRKQQLSGNLFVNEHGWWAHFSFINKYFPNAKVVLVKIPGRQNLYLESLYKKIKSLSLGPTLVIASVDFSHYVQEDFAQLHDRTAWYVLQSDEPYKAYKDLDVDCPSCLFVVNSRAKSLWKYPSLVERDSSSSIFKKDLGVQNTSRQVIFYTAKKSDLKQGVTLWFFGDVIFDRGVSAKLSSLELFKNHFVDWYQQSYIENSLENNFHRKWTSVDLLWFNLETPLYSSGQDCVFSGEKAIHFCSNDIFVSSFSDMWFNIVNISNNHSFDAWLDWYERTQSILKENNIVPFGNEIVETRIIRSVPVALHWYNLLENNSGDNKRYCEILQKYKKSEYKNIVNLHWGVEYATGHNLSQERLAKYFINCGADIIIGHHPHTVQDIWWYKGKPIIYSLGNFLFDQYNVAATGMYVLADIPLSGNITIWTGEIKSIP